MDSDSVLLSGGNYGRTASGDGRGTQDMSLSGYSHSTCFRSYIETYGQTYQPGGAAQENRPDKGAGAGYLSADYADQRFSGRDPGRF